MQPTEQELKTVRITARLFFSVSVIFAVCLAFVFAKSAEYNPTVKYFTSAGAINQPVRVWDGIITVTTGTAQSVDISSAGFTSINSVVVTPANNTASTTSMPIVSIKSYTATSVVFNTLVSNTAGIGILVGLIVPSSTTGMQVHVHVDGW